LFPWVGGRDVLIRVGGPALPYDPTYHLLWRVDKVRAIVRRERPDVLEIHSPYVAAAAALSVPRAHFGVRTFQWHADFIDTYLRTMLERRVSSTSADLILAPLWAMVRRIAEGCDATFVASRWQVDKLREHGVPRVVHMPFGIERETFTPKARSAARRRELLGPGREKATLLVGVGRFAVEKQWEIAIEAFAAFRKKSDAVFVILGDGPERDKMETLARSLGLEGDLKMPGFSRDREDLAAILASADALVHSCPFETFGLSVAEAMSCGLPVVAPDAGGAGELADPTCAERFPAGDVRGCAEAIERLLARDREALRAAAVEAAARLPSVREHFERMVQVYGDLLKRR
jgi:alpha-1,6-mannosyltransferase